MVRKPTTHCDETARAVIQILTRSVFNWVLDIVGAVLKGLFNGNTVIHVRPIGGSLQHSLCGLLPVHYVPAFVSRTQ